jgi:hypothetical protein
MQYTIENEDTEHYRGFAGRRFVIRFHDGRIVETTNLWSNGIIPEHFRDRLLDNACWHVV